MKNKKISIAMLTKNSEKFVAKVLESIKWADEIIVVDDFSRDSTIDICKKYTSKIYKRKLNKDFAAQKNFAISKATSDWIFMIDDDEIISDKLKQEILIEIKNDSVDACYIKRIEYVYDKIPFCKVKILRLFKKGIASVSGKIHEVISVKKGSRIKNLNGYLHHYNHSNIHYITEKNNFYTDIESASLIKKNNFLLSFFIPFLIIFMPFYGFFDMYILRKMFLKGMPGFMFSFCSGVYQFLRFAKYYEKKMGYDYDGEKRYIY
jgi:glycosyltransferase involved in cell wall biosynthesis